MLAVVILGMVIAQRLGYEFPGKKARRKARRKRKNVLWEYERDDD